MGSLKMMDIRHCLSQVGISLRFRRTHQHKKTTIRQYSFCQEYWQTKQGTSYIVILRMSRPAYEPSLPSWTALQLRKPTCHSFVTNRGIRWRMKKIKPEVNLLTAPMEFLAANMKLCSKMQRLELGERVSRVTHHRFGEPSSKFTAHGPSRVIGLTNSIQRWV